MEYEHDHGHANDHGTEQDCSGHHHHHHRDVDGLHKRLARIQGQVKAIDRMIADSESDCVEILSQINAVKSALHSCGKLILEDHIRHCIADGIREGDAEQSIEDFTKAVERFANMS